MMVKNQNGRQKSAKSLSKRFGRFKKTMYDTWEAHVFVGFYSPHLHERVKDGSLPAFRISQIASTNPKTLSKNSTFGTIAHITSVVSPRATFLTCVAVFEQFHSDLCTRVFHDYPMKMKTGVDDQEQSERQHKLLDIILTSTDKDEMLQRIIEERARGIFYGNPIDFFIFDKGKLEFGSTFKTDYSDSMTRLAEVIARRNVYVHNDSRVDRKYLREVKGSSAKLGEKLDLPDEYLRPALDLMVCITAVSAQLVCERIYKYPSTGTLAKYYKRARCNFQNRESS